MQENTCYTISVKKINEGKKTKMTKAEKDAYKARVKEFIDAGVDKELAKTIAKVEVEYGIIKPVVNTLK